MFHDLLVHVAPLLDPAVSQRLLAGQAGFLAYLRRRLANPHEAEDVLQEFSVKVIRGARTAGQDETINAWLGQILRHTLIDHYRRRAVRSRCEGAYAQELRIEAETPDAASSPGTRPCLHTALPRLRPDHAEILQRADLAEEPRARIAADLGLTTNALNVRLHRARTALRQEMQASCPDFGMGCILDCPHA